MSWNSLFAFDATGRVGSTYSATGVTITALVGASAVQNLATFTGLPVGIYSVQVSVPLVNTTGIASVPENWIIGASSVSTVSSTLALGSKSIISFPTVMETETSSSTITTDFILNNTSGTASIFINSSFTNGTLPNVLLSWNATTPTTATIVATKLA